MEALLIRKATQSYFWRMNFTVDDPDLVDAKHLEDCMNDSDELLNTLSALIIVGLCVFWAGDLWSWAWDFKWRLAMFNGIQTENVIVKKKPIDCNFWSAPIGVKNCTYEKDVRVGLYGLDDKTAVSIVSYDGGKSWERTENIFGISGKGVKLDWYRLPR